MRTAELRNDAVVPFAVARDVFRKIVSIEDHPGSEREPWMRTLLMFLHQYDPPPQNIDEYGSSGELKTALEGLKGVFVSTDGQVLPDVAAVILSTYVIEKGQPPKIVDPLKGGAGKAYLQSMLLTDPGDDATEGPVVDRAAAKGGIDFAQSNLDLLIKRDGAGMPLPVSQQNLDNIRISGLVPVILDIRPASSVPALM